MKPVTAISLLLDKRKPKPMNILIGSEGSVIRALEQKFDITIAKFNPEDPKPFSYVEIELDIPLDVRASAAVWDNSIISGNEGVFRYLVNASAVTPLSRVDAEDLAKDLARYTGGIRDFRVLYWTVWDRANRYEKKVWDKLPWESALGWATGSLPLRFAAIEREIKAFCYARDDNKQELTNLKISAVNASRLKSTKYSSSLMYDTLVQISRWRTGKQNEFQTAAIISSIWSPE